MVDSSSAALLSELNQKKKRVRMWPLAASLSVVLLFLLGAVGASSWIIAPVAVLCSAAVVCSYQFDLLKKTVVILYDFDTDMEGAYQRLHDSVSHLARCGGKWHILAHGDVYNRKYHAGANQLVRRTRLSVTTGAPPYVRTNIRTPVIYLGARTLFFFPERLLVFAKDGVGAVSYDNLGIVANDSRFIENESVPRDAQVVDQTWEYVNKNGGPDRRFNSNRQLPICRYEELSLQSPSGLNEVIQVSRGGIGEQLNLAVKSLAEMVAKALPRPASALHSVETKQASCVAPGPDERRGEGSPSSQSQQADYVFHAMLDILCCVMVADGRASRSEKRCIHELMTKLGSPWNDSEVTKRISAFIERVRKDGYQETLALALKEVKLFKRLGKQGVLLRCLDAVARADGNVTDKEFQLCRRVREIVE